MNQNRTPSWVYIVIGLLLLIAYLLYSDHQAKPLPVATPFTPATVAPTTPSRYLQLQQMLVQLEQEYTECLDSPGPEPPLDSWDSVAEVWEHDIWLDIREYCGYEYGRKSDVIYGEMEAETTQDRVESEYGQP